MDEQVKINKELLDTQPNPFGEKSREESGSERKGGMPGEAGIQGATLIRVADFAMQSEQTPVSILANITIQYSPRKYVIAAEDVSLYARQFRTFYGTPEEAVELFSRHFVEQVEPMTFQMTTEFAQREGVTTSPGASWMHPEMVRQQQRSANQPSGLALPPGTRLS